MAELTRCPHCGNSDASLVEPVKLKRKVIGYVCLVCSKTWPAKGTR